MRGEPDHDQHERDRHFLSWVLDPSTFSADLRAKWYEVYDIGWLPDRWKLTVIERELERRGEGLVCAPGRGS